MSHRRSPFSMATISMLPVLLIVAVYLGTMIWTINISFTDSKILPTNNYVGIANYERLFTSSRWIVSLENLAIFGILFIIGCLLIGTLIAVYMDQKIRAESLLRTIFLYPYAMSFIVTGLAWQWMLNPDMGIQQAVRAFGFTGFDFDWIVDRDMAIYTVIIAAIWQSAGLVMVLMLAGLRGIDEDLWKAIRVDGIPNWRAYLSIVLPNLTPMIGTAVVLLSIATVKVYDLVVAMTAGGPGMATEVPAKFIMDSLFNRADIAIATAAATVLLVIVICIIAPLIYAKATTARRRKLA